jgi:hypothetical protein
MVVLIGDGQSPFIKLPAKVVAVYDEFGRMIYGAEQLTKNLIQQGLLKENDKDLPDIALRNGLPYAPLTDVTADYPQLGKGQQAFKFKQ